MNQDLISRDAVLDACSQSINILDAMSRIEDLPSVTPKQRTGHWNWNYDENMLKYAVCSACGWDTEEALEYAIKYFKHCPNCAARMVEPQKSEGKDGNI